MPDTEGAGPSARPPPSGPTPSGCRSASRPTRPHLAQARLGRSGRPHPARHPPVGPHRQQRRPCSGRRRPRIPARTLLGDDQAAWLEQQIRESTARWKLVGQQVMVANLILSPGMIVNLDQWHGYPASRRRFLEFLRTSARQQRRRADRRHPQLVGQRAGDRPAATPPSTIRPPAAAPSPSSSSPRASPAPACRPSSSASWNQARPYNPHLRWFDLMRQGYMVLDVVPERVQAAWFLYADITQPRAPRRPSGPPGR